MSWEGFRPLRHRCPGKNCQKKIPVCAAACFLIRLFRRLLPASELKRDPFEVFDLVFKEKKPMKRLTTCSDLFLARNIRVLRFHSFSYQFVPLNFFCTRGPPSSNRFKTDETVAGRFFFFLCKNGFAHTDLLRRLRRGVNRTARRSNNYQRTGALQCIARTVLCTVRF